MDPVLLLGAAMFMQIVRIVARTLSLWLVLRSRVELTRAAASLRGDAEVGEHHPNGYEWAVRTVGLAGNDGKVRR